jgi:acetyl esterase/lipase
MLISQRSSRIWCLLGSVTLLLFLAACGQEEPGPVEANLQISADRTSIQPGECATLTWRVQGGFGVELDGEAVQGEGGRQVCPHGTTTYTLRVDTGERLAEASVEVQVAGDGSPAPFPSEGSPQPYAENDQIAVERDLTYGTYSLGGGAQPLKLDLYLPAGDTPLPVLVYIHGGGWIEGSKEGCPGGTFARYGYAVACVDYRLAPLRGGCTAELIFPAQIQDVKAAVRWLRMNADAYRLDVEHVGAFGDSSGGHLASLLGTSAGAAELQGDQNPGFSDAVQAVADWYGPVDVTQEPPKLVFTDDPCASSFMTLSDEYGGEATPYFYWTFAWSAFLGGSLEDTRVLQQAWRASPLAYVDSNDPPFLIIHGENDGMIPIEQSALLATALQNAGVEVTFLRLQEPGHNFCDPNKSCPDVFPEFLDPTLEFFDEFLK